MLARLMLCLLATGQPVIQTKKPTIEKTIMKKTLSTYEAAGYLMNDENANWSRAGAYALVEYLEQIEDETGEEIELDAVALRCDWSEYSSLIDWHNEYFGNGFTFEDTIGASERAEDSEVNDKIREYIQDHGQLIEFDGGIIVSSF